MFRYVHTNIIAKDVNKMIEFYKNVFNCKSIGETRDLKGEWLDRLTGLKNAHLKGEHLLLPGYGDNCPTLEIFSYDEMKDVVPQDINRPGIAHLAFEVENAKNTLDKILKHGGSMLGELVMTEYPNNKMAMFVYAKDIEGNIIELQSWEDIK